MSTLAIDIETYSSIDLGKHGVYRYVEAEDFEILLVGYAFDDGPVFVADLATGMQFPPAVLEALTDPNVIKTAWNAQFERVCLERYLNRIYAEVIEMGLMEPIRLDPAQWLCSMVHAYYLGLPGSLDAAAKALGVKEQKDPKGGTLIRYFSVPCRPTKANGGRTRNLPEQDRQRWAQFVDYCAQDVIVEREIRAKLSKRPLPEKEHRLWALDQKINARGVRLDIPLVEAAVTCHNSYRVRLIEEATRLTGLENPNSVSQLKAWLEEATGMEIETLNKSAVPEILAATDDALVHRVLELRGQLAKSSIKKYEAMQRTCCDDGRARGLLQFYGAGRTGRWAGRLIQVQNLPRNTMAGLDHARTLLRYGYGDALELLYDDVPDVLSQLLRTALIPSPHRRFIVADFSAIEARVIAWLAGERWRLEVFRTHGKIYEASASQMFRVPIEDVDRELRQKGKIAELALGYQGGPGALKSMGALEMGLTEEELQPLVDAWRAANPSIVSLWHTLNDAALRAVRNRECVELPRGLVIYCADGFMVIRLPSGRELHYARPRIEPDPKFGHDGVTYEGQEMGKWGRLRTYGGRLTENVTQAVARDCLAEALLRLEAAGYDIVFHVHDEVVIDAPCDADPETVCELMTAPLEWAPDLPLAAEAFICDYYQKD